MSQFQSHETDLESDGTQSFNSQAQDMAEFSARQMPESDIREEMIRRRAYELYEARGEAGGSDLDDWLAAEREVDLDMLVSADETAASDTSSTKVAASKIRDAESRIVPSTEPMAARVDADEVDARARRVT